jgi:oxygen-independent coproporphyrinogen-3 oxidase
MSPAPALPPLALYVHMPWCVRKCPYCDFNSHALREAAPDSTYIDALLADLDLELPDIGERRIETLFFGGGTPSLFAPHEIGRLLRGLRERVAFAADAEITLEANPGTIERGHFAAYRDAGITRVSLGAQSFSGQALEALGRIHSPDDTCAAVAELRSAGIDNFNLDLMYALPGQDVCAARADVETAIGLGPAHVSYYHLTLEPGTVFHARPPPLPDEDAAWDMQAAGQELLAGAGYAQYEVSAYARPGAACRHNLNYWSFGDYVGLGAGAHGKLSRALPADVLRSAKPRQPRSYQAALALRERVIGERRVVPAEDLPFEFMLNALRLNAGFTAALFEAHTGLSVAVIASPLARAQAQGLLAPLPGPAGAGWMPTPLGRRFLNDLQGLFLG